MTRREHKTQLLKEALKYPVGSPDRAYRLRAAFTYLQAIMGVPAKDWKFG